MAKKNLIPSLWKGTQVPARGMDNLLDSFQQRMNEMFEEFFRGFNVAMPGSIEESFGAFHPSIDVKEGETDIVVKADLPGLEEKDIDVLLTEDNLTIKGEKSGKGRQGGKLLSSGTDFVIPPGHSFAGGG